VLDIIIADCLLLLLCLFIRLLPSIDYHWPPEVDVSDSAVDFVDKLLCLDSNTRLGAKGMMISLCVCVCVSVCVRACVCVHVCVCVSQILTHFLFLL